MEELHKILDRLPVVSGVRRDAGQLRDLLYERRAPRIIAIGSDAELIEELFRRMVEPDRGPAPTRPGSAVAAAGVRPWVRRGSVGGEILFLPLVASDADAAFSFAEAVDRTSPDVVLCVVAASDDEATADSVAACVAGCFERIPLGVARPKLLPLVLTSIEAARDVDAEATRRMLAKRVTAHGLRGEMATTVSLDPFVTPGESGLELLTSRIVDALPMAARVAACRALAHAHDARRTVASAIVQSCAAIAISVAVTPIPLSDLVVIAPLQVAMVSSLAYIGGRTIDRKLAVEWISSVGLVGGAGFGLRWSAQQLFKLVPGAGSLISAGIAGSGTAALGQAAMAYFVPDIKR